MLNEFFYQVTQVQSLTSTISRILLLPHIDPLIYQAGQYVNVILSNDDVAPLSIACAPNEQNQLEFHLYHCVANPRSIKILKMSLEEKQWHLAGPFGVCTANLLDVTRPIIFFAQGTGFAPIKAIIESFIKNNSIPEMHLYWWVNNEAELYDVGLIAHWQEQFASFKFTPLYVENVAIVPEQVLQAHPELTGYQVYAVASRKVVLGLLESCKVRGVERADFYSDMI